MITQLTDIKKMKTDLLTLLTMSERLSNVNDNPMVLLISPDILPQGELVEEERFTAEYFGEKAIQVKQKFHSLIKEQFERLLAKYPFLHPHIVVASCDANDGYYNFPNLLGVTSGSFLVGEIEKPVQGMSCLVHESGHYKANKLYGDALRPSPDFENVHRNIMTIRNLGFIDTFKDCNFINTPGAGHPEENPGELYASAFMIAEMGFIPKYKELFFPKLTEEQKHLAERIFEFVQRTR